MGTVLTRLLSHWVELCSGAAELAVLELTDEHVMEEKALVFTNGSVLHGDTSGWNFSVRMKGTFIAERSL